MKQSHFTFKADDGADIFACRWNDLTREKAIGIVQIAHGMAEHILRYDAFARFLVSKGFIVYAHDHRGHGKTAKTDYEAGYFADHNGFEQVVRDMKTYTDYIQQEHPNIPIILFGHSMGSFLSRRYIQLFGQKLAGVILSGTGGDKGLVGKVGLIIAKWESKRNGARTPSPLLDKLTFGGFNKAFKPNRTAFDFLSRDNEQVDLYMRDPKCGNVFTAGFFVDLIGGIALIHQKKEIAKIPKQLPIFIISGKKDPVGNNGKAVRTVYEQYKRTSIKNVSLKLYVDARHEILNETNKDDVYEDIEHWIRKIIKEGKAPIKD